MKNIYLLLLLTFSMMAVGCDGWPPRAEDALSHFQKSEQALNALKVEFEKTRLPVINHGVLGEVGIPKDQSEAEKLTRQQKERFTRLLEDAGVMGVSRKGDVVYFELASPIRSDRQYIIKYGMGSENQIHACQPAFKELACGVCSVSIDSQWWIEYSWYPDDTEVEITQCFAEGMEKIKAAKKPKSDSHN